jgi:hypothetical protein
MCKTIDEQIFAPPPKPYPSIDDINRLIDEWYKKTGVLYSYGKYVYLQSIGRVP